MSRLSAKDRRAFLASATQADAARIVGIDGKTFRNGTRSMLGVFVSKGLGAWDDRTRAFRLALHEADTPDARRSIALAFREGKATPFDDDADTNTDTNTDADATPDA